MGHVYGFLHERLSIVKIDMSKFLFVMIIFNNFSPKLPPFADHLECIFEMKENTTIDGKTNMLPADLIQCELFYPTHVENQGLTKLTKKLAEEVARVCINELEDPKKATSYHLYSTAGKWIWGQVTDIKKKAGLGMQDTNDYAESLFAGMKEECCKFGSQLNPLHASAAGHARFNRVFFCIETERTRFTPDPSVTDGFFFDLKEHSPEMISFDLL